MPEHPSTLPFTSVIIPTYNRRESLRRLLASLGEQTCPAGSFEVIVVDDGGSDGTEEVAKQALPFRLRYHRQRNQGDAIARNTGAQQSTAEVLIFIDDDIVVAPESIAGFIRDLDGGEKRVTIGLLKPWPNAATTPFERLNAKAWEDRTSAVGEVPFSECLSGFLALRRRDFLELGMLQPVTQAGSSIWCDVEFAYRAHNNGFTFRRGAEAVGYHDDYVLRDMTTNCRRTERAARTAVQLFAKHPDLFPHIPMFQDKGPIAWHADPPRLIASKLARQVISSPPALRGMEGIVRVLETRYPSPAILERLYRWIISAYIYRGYRTGLRESLAGITA